MLLMPVTAPSLETWRQGLSHPRARRRPKLAWDHRFRFAHTQTRFGGDFPWTKSAASCTICAPIGRCIDIACPAQVHRKIEAMWSSGQLRVICGRLVSASTDDSGEITVRILGGSPARETPISATRVINCTEPNNDPRKQLEEGDAVETDPQKYVADLLMAQLEIPDGHEPGKRWCTPCYVVVREPLEECPGCDGLLHRIGNEEILRHVQQATNFIGTREMSGAPRAAFRRTRKNSPG
jgi:hypothetical protein